MIFKVFCFFSNSCFSRIQISGAIWQENGIWWGRMEQMPKLNQKTDKWRDKSMEKHSYDEKNGLSYTLHGDYYLPDLVLTGKLTEHLNQIDE